MRLELSSLRAEQALEREGYLLYSLLNNTTDHIYFKNRKSQFFRINPALAAVFGLEHPEEIIGKTDYDFFTEEHALEAYEDEQTIIQTGNPIIGKEEKETWPSGKITWVSTTKMPLYDDDGNIVGTFGISRDITSSKQAAHELELAAEKLINVNRELEQFAYACSHDLQEPLRKVRAFGDRLKTKCGQLLSEEGNDYLSRMLNSTKRMQSLIDALLTYSRVTTKAKPLTDTDLNEIVSDVLCDLEVRIEETQGHVDVSPLPHFKSDPTQMRQLFQNLIANGLKFHREGIPPQIKIYANLTPFIEDDPEEFYWQLVIEDNGIGFDEKYLGKLFIPFGRLHGRGDYEGTGIGLAVCRKITERHDGKLTAHSSPGQGSQFIAMLPKEKLMNP